MHTLNEYFKSDSIHSSQLTINAIASFLSISDWLDNVLIPTNHKRLRKCHSVVTDALEKANIPVVPSCSGLYVWIDLRKYLNPLSFEAEKNLADMFIENGSYINAGKVFMCCEPGWYRVVIASDPSMVKIGKFSSNDLKFWLLLPA